MECHPFLSPSDLYKKKENLKIWIYLSVFISLYLRRFIRIYLYSSIKWDKYLFLLERLISLAICLWVFLLSCWSSCPLISKRNPSCRLKFKYFKPSKVSLFFVFFFAPIVYVLWSFVSLFRFAFRFYCKIFFFFMELILVFYYFRIFLLGQWCDFTVSYNLILMPSNDIFKFVYIF